MTLFTSLVRDGAFYFAAIFSVNLLWVIMILHGPTALRSVFGVYVLSFKGLVNQADLLAIQSFGVFYLIDDLQDHSQLAFNGIWPR